MSNKIEKLVEQFFAKQENVFGVEHINHFILEQLLQEKRGVTKFSKGQIFSLVDKPEEKYSVEQVIFLPEGGGRYDSKEKTKQTIEQIIKEGNMMLHEINSVATAALIVVLADKNKKLHAYIKYFRDMTSNGHDKWMESDFIRDTKLKPEAGKDKISSSEMEGLPLKPTDLVGDGNPRTISELIDTVLNNAKNKNIPPVVLQHLNQILNAAAKNEKQPVILKDGARYSSVYNLYVSEILAPISILTGWLSSGDREASEKALLKYDNKENKYSPQMTISFNSNPNDALFDSSVQFADKPLKVLISSKGGKSGKGASASLKGINDSIIKIKKDDTKKYRELYEKYSVVFEILEIIRSNKYYASPIRLANFLGLINENEEKIGNQIILQGRNIADKDVQNLISKSANLKKYWINYSAKEGYVPYFRFISSLAKACSEKINSDNQIKFHECMTKILENGLIQVNSKGKIVNGADYQFTDFSIKYPPVISGTITLESGKTYSAKEIKGNFTFKIP